MILKHFICLDIKSIPYINLLSRQLLKGSFSISHQISFKLSCCEEILSPFLFFLGHSLRLKKNENSLRKKNKS